MGLDTFITAIDKKLIAEKFKCSVRYVEIVMQGIRSDGGSLNANNKAEQILHCAWLLAFENEALYESKRQILGLSNKSVVAHEANS